MKIKKMPIYFKKKFWIFDDLLAGFVSDKLNINFTFLSKSRTTMI